MHEPPSTSATQGVQTIEVGPERDGQRLDNCLNALLKGLPRSLIYRLLRSGQVRVNGGRSKPSRRLVAGDVLRIPPLRLAERGQSDAPAPGLLRMIQEAVIFEDEHFLAIDKPSGIASHGGSGISHGAIELLRVARPGDSLDLVHRLDRDTSGVLLFSRTRQGLSAVQSLIREHKVIKQYLALLEGRPDTARFDVNAPLRKSVLAGGERMVRVSDDGKPSLTFFKCLQHYPGASLHEVTLETGRTHQIRVHAAHVGHPVAGDEKYASRESTQHYRQAGLKRLFLHAARLEFDWHERSYCFSTPLPDELKEVLDAL